MSCKRCGRCCNCVLFDVPRGQASDFDMQEQADFYRAHGFETTIKGNILTVKINAKCKYLIKGNRCRIYKNRPPICREFDCEKSNVL